MEDKYLRLIIEPNNYELAGSLLYLLKFIGYFIDSSDLINKVL